MNVNGTLYGTTYQSNGGSVFSITTGGKVKILDQWHNWQVNGGGIEAGLANVNETLYGVAQTGGASSNNVAYGGTVFTLTTNGSKFRVIHSFGKGSDGFSPQSALINVNGVLYGMTSAGGSHNGGVIFAINHNKYRIIYNLPLSEGPATRGALMEHAGVLYGARPQAIFSIRIDGSRYRVLHTFGSPPNTVEPNGNLVYVNGVLYGTTTADGVANLGSVYRVGVHGNNYLILHSFHQLGNGGSSPYAGLIKVGNTLYGTTYFGGRHGGGVIFSITTGGSYNVLYDVASNNPAAPLINVGGTLYGTSEGPNNAIFALCR